MFKISIANKKVEVDSSWTILDVARKNNIYIPTLCYHDRLTSTGACRLCLVKIDKKKGFFASCTTKVEPNMKIIVQDDELDNARRYIIGYLLSEHNFSSDLSYNDEFVNIVINYGFDDIRQLELPSLWHGLKYSLDKTSSVLDYDGSKCVKCFRCIKACSDIQGKSILSFAGRGISKYVAAGYNTWSESECDGCGECIQLCPTGAIVEKPNRMFLRTSKIDHSVISTCPYCGVGCRIKLKVKNGKIVRINGVEKIKPNNGRLCIKGRFGYDFVSSVGRLTAPLVKVNGRFITVSWDYALRFVANKILEIKEKWGNNSMAGYSSAKCTNEDNYIFQKFMRMAIGTNNIDYCTRLCHASTVSAMIKSIGSAAGCNSIEDYEKADCILIIGNNMMETHPITATFVKKGVANGAKLIIIDPKWTPLVKFAKVWLQIKLGTDIAILNGLAQVIIEKDYIDTKFIEDRIRGGLSAFYRLKDVVKKYTPYLVEKITGVFSEKLIYAAEIFALSSKVMIASGMGVSQQLNGTNTVFSILNLCLITGKMGKFGSGLNPPRGQNNVQGASDVGCLPMYYPGYIDVFDIENRNKVADIWGVSPEHLPNEVGYSAVEIIEAADLGNVKGMYIMGENPMLSDPNILHTHRALSNLNFLLVQDIFFTETARLADVVLPGTSFAEKNGTFTNSDRRINRVRKAVIPPGEARQDWAIISDIAHNIGFDLGHYKNESDIFDEITRVAPILFGFNYDKIDIEGKQWPYSSIGRKELSSSSIFLDKFNTKDGLAVLTPVRYMESIEKASDKYPFLINTGRVLYQYHTGTMSRKSNILNMYDNFPCLLMNKNDAYILGLFSDDVVRVISKQGRIKAKLKVSDDVQLGELFISFHYAESAPNKLTRNDLDPVSKIPGFKRTACRVELLR